MNFFLSASGIVLFLVGTCATTLNMSLWWVAACASVAGIGLLVLGLTRD